MLYFIFSDSPKIVVLLFESYEIITCRILLLWPLCFLVSNMNNLFEALREASKALLLPLEPLCKCSHRSDIPNTWVKWKSKFQSNLESCLHGSVLVTEYDLMLGSVMLHLKSRDLWWSEKVLGFVGCGQVFSYILWYKFWIMTLHSSEYMYTRWIQTVTPIMG